tara:strand:+ start:1936 stop:2469 length:534 start_codon:yes stop_codon:yes gene_type:complete
MIVYVDGLSGTGKTTLVDTLCTRNPQWIRFKGAGAVNIGMGKDWQDYNFQMRNVIERLDQLNEYKKVILWDRGLTDCVYTEDRLYASEILRVMKSHANKCAVFLDFPEGYEDIQKTRKGFDTKEGDDAQTHAHRYRSVIKSFRHNHVILDEKNNFFLDEQGINDIETFIANELQRIN